MSQLKHQIIYFPYLTFRDKPLKFNDLVLWHFDGEKNNFIQDAPLRDYVSKLISTNVYRGKPIENIAIVSDEKPSFQPLTAKQIKATENFKSVLFLAGVSKTNRFYGDNAGSFMMTADNFTMVYQNFELGSKFTAFSTGSIVRINAGGHEVDKIKYERPPHVLTARYGMDEDLFNALAELMRSRPRIFQRIIRATDAFMIGYSNSDDIKMASRILQQARAFEILLNIPESNQRENFKKIIRKYCMPLHGQKVTVTYKSERRPGKFDNETDIIQVKWADRFYSLRNHIIHGNSLKKDELGFGKQLHQDLALWYYLVCVKKIVNHALRKRIFYDEIKWVKGRFEYEDNGFHRCFEEAWKKVMGSKKKLPAPQQDSALLN